MRCAPLILSLSLVARGAAGLPAILDEGSPLPNQPLSGLNFTGGGVQCVDNAAADRVDCAIGGGGATGPIDLNVPVDTDGDGFSDYAYVTDWDGDGNLEIEDVRAALDSLTDGDGRVLRVGAGVYAPTAPITNPLLALPDHTTLTCDAGTVLRGHGVEEPAASVHLIANEDQTNGNRGITMIGCEIDGGLCQTPGCYNSNALNLNGSRMGVFFDSVTDLRVLRNHIHDTHHACLYLRNNTRAWVDGNVMERCGGINNADSYGQPCMYLFASSGKVQSDMLVTGNFMTQCRVNAINFRVGDPEAFHRDYTFRDNAVVDTGPEGSSCLSIHGVENAVVDGLRCQGSRGPIIGPGTASGLDRYPYDHDALVQVSSGNWMGTARTRNVVLRNLQVVGFGGGAGLTVSSYNEDVLVEKAVIEGSADAGGASDCLSVKRPQRRLIFRDVVLRNCPRHGLEASGDIRSTDEHIVFENFEIDTVGVTSPTSTQGKLLFFSTFAEGIHFDGLVLRNPRGDFTSFYNGLANSSFRNVWADGLYTGFVGEFSVADAVSRDLETCDADLADKWLLLTDGDGSCATPWGSGSQGTRCRCIGGSWIYFLPPQTRLFRPRTAPWSDVLFDNLYVQNLQNAWAIDFDSANHDGIVIRNGFATNNSAAMLGLGTMGVVDWPTSGSASGLFSSALQCTGTFGSCEGFHGLDGQFAREQQFIRPTDGEGPCLNGQHNRNTSSGDQQICRAGAWQPVGIRPIVSALSQWLPESLALLLLGAGVGVLAHSRRRAA